jgi:perosamine synthetase
MPLSSDTLIPVAGPSITQREEHYAAEAARSAWFADHYSFNRRFEEAFAAYIGVRHAISLPHATAGLHLALAASGIGPEDEVIVPDVTWIASVAPVTYVGAQPVFVDILPDTWCLDPQAVRAAITPKTRAIIGVDLYGSMCDWQALRAITHEHNLILIEDAAEALGSEYQGRKAGSLGDMAVFSFHGSKTLVTGEGGMIVTDDDHLASRIHILRDHGRDPGDRFFQNREIAFKYKMSAVQAALGLAQIERIDDLIAQKRAIFHHYRDRLQDIDDIAINAEPDNIINSAWMVTMVPHRRPEWDKFHWMDAFRKRNVDTRPFFSRLSTLPAFANMPEAARFLPDLPKGQHASTYGINLPSGYHMDEDTIDLVCRILKDLLQN